MVLSGANYKPQPAGARNVSRTYSLRELPTTVTSPVWAIDRRHHNLSLDWAIAGHVHVRRARSSRVEVIKLPSVTRHH